MLAFNFDERLQDLGIDEDDYGVLLLVPASAVAWADGESDMRELETIARRHQCDCEEADCLCVSEKARQFLYYNFVYRKPDAALLRKAMNCLRVFLALQEEKAADRLRWLTFEICLDVAKSSGGSLLSKGLDQKEKLVLANIGGALGFHDMEQLEKAMSKGAKP